MNPATLPDPAPMGRFSDDRVYLSIGNGQKFRVERELVYSTDVIAGSDRRRMVELAEWDGTHGRVSVPQIYIPRGYETDLLSIPWWIQWRLDKLGKGNLASLPHDYLLDNRDLYPYTRAQIDEIFREALIDLGVSRYEVKLMYAGVRVNSWWRGIALDIPRSIAKLRR